MYNDMDTIHFEWSDQKNRLNLEKHGVSFGEAQEAFKDKRRAIVKDIKHSQIEQRYYCIGKVGKGIITVRFTYRAKAVRIIGAGYWRQGKKVYEKENRLH